MQSCLTSFTGGAEGKLITVPLVVSIPKCSDETAALIKRDASSKQTVLEKEKTTPEHSKAPKISQTSADIDTSTSTCEYKSKDSKQDDPRDQEHNQEDQQQSSSKDDETEDEKIVSIEQPVSPNQVQSSKERPIRLMETVRDFVLFSLAESILSQILNIRVSHLDVLRIFIEIMKLSIKSRGIEQNSRLEERLLQLQHMGEIVDSFKNQGRTLLMSGIVAGVMAVVSGVSPILGQIKGESILNKLGMVFSGLKNMESEKFFENTSKITLAVSEMSKATGQVQTAFSESHRAYDEHMKESYKVDADERTRALDEIKDNWKSIENFLYQSLQMYHDTTKSLYQ